MTIHIYRNPKNGLVGTSGQWAERVGASSASAWYKRFHRLRKHLGINKEEALTDLRMLQVFEKRLYKKGRPSGRKPNRPAANSQPTKEWLELDGTTPRTWRLNNEIQV